MSTYKVEELFNAGLAYGYRRARRHPSTAAFIHGQKGGVDVIDLDKTVVQLTVALEVVTKTVASGKKVLFVGGKNEARMIVRASAEKVDHPFVTGRWIGGTLTNFAQISKRLKRLATLIEGKEKGGWDKYTKLERLMLDRERAKLELMFGGIAELKELPGLLVIVDPRHDETALREARMLNIPVVVLANTDCDISGVTYPVVGNDATASAIRFFMAAVVQAVEAGAATKADASKAAPAK